MTTVKPALRCTMRRSLSLTCVVALSTLSPIAAAPAAAQSAPAPVLFRDGATGTARASCGAGDECAALKLEDGDRVVLYNAGAAHCKPYQLRIVRFHGEQVLFSSEQQTNKNSDSSGPFGTTCGTYKTTVLTLANGHRLTINQHADGTLFARWDEGAGAQQAQTAADDDAYEHPTRCIVSAGILSVPIPWREKRCAEARNLVRAQLGVPGEPEPVETVDGHPRRCANGDVHRVTVALWESSVCAKAREQWAAVMASPSPSPRP